MSIWKAPVDPDTDGFTNRPTVTPNCPEFDVFGNIPVTLIVVFPLESVPTVQVSPTADSNILAQVFREVAPPVLVDDTFKSDGMVMIT